MKKLIKIFMFILISVNCISAQNNTHDFNFNDLNKNQNEVETKLVCVTVSCCSLVVVSVEVWSHTVCYYVEVEENGEKSYNAEIKFNSENDVNESVVFEHDVLLPGYKTENGNSLILPKGEYLVENNVLTANLVESKVNNETCYCVTKVVEGSFLGHDYSYSVTVCLCISKSANNRGLVVITPELSDEEIDGLSRENTFRIKNDVKFDKDDFNFTIPKGEYYINENGDIYIPNFDIK